MTIPTVTFEQESQLLDYLTTLWPGPYSCLDCENLISEAGWKPQIVMLADSTGVYQAEIHIYCGKCFPREMEPK